MLSLVDKLNSSKNQWYWSLKPGLFVDKMTGKNICEDFITGQWAGTLLQWNSTLLLLCSDMAKSLFGSSDEKDLLYISSIIFSKFTPEMIKLWHGKILVDDNLPFNSILLEMYCGNVATIKVLNMNEKGNLI